MLQELTYWAEGSPEHQLRRNTLDAIPTLYEDAFNDPGDGWEGSGNLGQAAASPGPSPLSQGQGSNSPGDSAHITHGGSPSSSHTGSHTKNSEDGDSIFSMKGISRESCCTTSCAFWVDAPLLHMYDQVLSQLEGSTGQPAQHFSLTDCCCLV